MSGDNPYEGPPPMGSGPSSFEAKPKPDAAVGVPEGRGPEAKDAKTWALFAHLSPVILIALGVGMVGGSFLGPLIIWLVKKEENDYVADQAKEALNFQLTLLIAFFVGVAITLATCFVVPVVVVVPILQLVFGIIAAIKSSNGEWYRYPMTIRMIT